MKIDEKIQRIQKEVIKILTECKEKEIATQLLEQYGLDNDSAIKLIDAFIDMNNKKAIATETWDSAWISKSGVDFSTDIAKSQQNEFESAQYFENINNKTSIIILVKTINPSEINQELLDKLYEEGVQETQIDNQALKTAYHYYNESKIKDEEIVKIREAKTRVESHNFRLINQKKNIENEYNTIKRAYENLQEKFKARIASDEEHYQSALSQISVLKDMISQLQDRSIFKTITSKLKQRFINKREELHVISSEIPDTLYKNNSEKMGIAEHGDEEMVVNVTENESLIIKKGDEELQQ